MMNEFPLRPPDRPLPAALGWVLMRAFGPGNASVASPDPETAFQLASQLSLASRIGGRNKPELLISELGREGAEAFRRRYRLTAASVLLQQELCRTLAEIAAGLDAPIVFLKGAALNLSDGVPIGYRESSDIDLLLRREDAEKMEEALKAVGWKADELPLGEQHLTPLHHPEGMGTVELHWRLIAFGLARGQRASLDGLDSLGLVLPMDKLPGNCFRLSTEAQLGHLLTHALGQHLWYPGSYPQLRFLADFADLGVDVARWTEIEDIVRPWIEADVEPAVVDAAIELLAELRAGVDPAEIWAGEEPPSRYLRHVILGWSHPEYAESIRFRSVSRGVRQPGEKIRAGWSLVKQSFWLTRGQVDLLYGKPKGPLGYLGWRLYRPFDVVLRMFRYGRSWIALRVRKKTNKD